MIDVATVRTEGLGDSTHILTFDGQAVVVDPQRDYDRFEPYFEQANAQLRFVLETHVHNDYVSGGRDLASKHGGQIVMPAGSAPVFRHTPAFHNEDLIMGDLIIRPLHTPGHTPEHVSYLVVHDGAPVLVFSGGSLLVGSAGRSDLLGWDRAESLSRLQYRSVTRLAALGDDVALYPTHGAGSFCTTTVGGSANSTIGLERETSHVLSHEDEDSFVAAALSGLVPYPAYYPNMAPLNLQGPDTAHPEVAEVERPPEGTTIIDGRPKADFAARHYPGSIGIPLRDSFGTWVGWLTEFNTPLALVLNEDQDLDDAVRQLIRIGYEDLRGVIRSVPEAASTFERADVTSFAAAARDGAQILDVRAPDEWSAGHIEHSVHSYLPDLAREIPEALDPDKPVWVACQTGLRATTAASILQDGGYQPIVLDGAGVTDVITASSN